MKTNNRSAKLLAFAFLAALLPMTGYSQSQNIIRQTNLHNGLQYDIVTTVNSGSGTAFMPMQQGGASFELYAYGSAWDTNLYFLDRKVIGHYLPKATIQVNTGDPYSDFFTPGQPPRTRADKPYTLAIKVEGLTTDPEAPAAAKKVLYSHVGQNYNGTYTPAGNAEYVLSSYYLGNQSPNFTPVYTQLTPMAPTKAMGIETFTISSLTDETVPESSILAEEMILVWPVTEAAIEGMEDNYSIRDSLPNLVVTYRDLYPLSYTYVHIYPGAPALGQAGPIFPGSVRWHNTLVPQNEIVSIENWEEMIPTDGQYTIEVVTMTPFDNWQPERLAYKTFNVNRKVTVNGQVITSEK